MIAILALILAGVAGVLFFSMRETPVESRIPVRIEDENPRRKI